MWQKTVALRSMVARFADFIPGKWKSGDIEIACGNVENPGKFEKIDIWLKN